MKSLMSIIVFDIHVRHPHGRKNKLNDGSFNLFYFFFFISYLYNLKGTLLIAIVVAQMQ